ncbi:MAG: LysM peptidoglycan-binding domain-containing protein [Rikenellaceae bacterium]
MKRLVLALTCALAIVASANFGSSQAVASKGPIVYIHGERFYVYSVQPNDTLYSLSKKYGVAQGDLITANPQLAEGLKAGANIKIPAFNDGISKPASEKKLRKTYDLHSVEQGETFYAISRKYQIPVATLIEDNPTIDPSVLSIGQQVNIRKSEQGVASEADTRAGLDGYRQQLNRVAPAGLQYHVVSASDKISTLAKRYRMTEREIISINRLDADNPTLQVGTILLLRDASTSRATADAAINAYKDLLDVNGDFIERCNVPISLDFTKLEPYETLNIALLLPLSMRGQAMKPFEEFYRGFLLGVENLKKSGRSVVVNLYNTERDAAKVEAIISSVEYKSSNLVVGPVYEELYGKVLSDAAKRGVPVVSPLATLQNVDGPALFQMAPPVENRYDKLVEILSNPDNTITLIYGEGTDSSYDSEMRKLIRKSGASFAEHTYIYEHPTQMKENRDLIEKHEGYIKRNPDDADVLAESTRVIDSLNKLLLRSDLSPIMLNEAKQNVYFIMSKSELEVDRILSALTSAYVSLGDKFRDPKNRSAEKIAPSQYIVIANPEWRNYANIDRASYFRNRVVALSSYLAGRDAVAVREFDSRYSTEYSEIPSMYSYRGYDAAVIFGTGMFGDIQYGMENRSFTPLQTTYRFERAKKNSKRVNTNWMRVDYGSNFKLNVK